MTNRRCSKRSTRNILIDLSWAIARLCGSMCVTSMYREKVRARFGIVKIIRECHTNTWSSTHPQAIAQASCEIHLGHGTGQKKKLLSTEKYNNKPLSDINNNKGYGRATVTEQQHQNKHPTTQWNFTFWICRTIRHILLRVDSFLALWSQIEVWNMLNHFLSAYMTSSML